MPLLATCQWNLAWNAWPLPVCTSRMRNGELGDDLVDEGIGARLIMALMDLEGPHTGCIINGGVLAAPDRLVVWPARNITSCRFGQMKALGRAILGDLVPRIHQVKKWALYFAACTEDENVEVRNSAIDKVLVLFEDIGGG